MVAVFSEISTCHSEQHDLKIIHIFINTQQIFMFNVSILMIFLWEIWLKKPFHDGDGDDDDDPCKNALTAPEPLLASAHSFSNISTILVLKNT